MRQATIDRYKRLAEKGDSNVQYKLCKYCTFTKVQLMVKQSLLNAQISLGLDYYFSPDVPQNNEKAVQWFRVAATQGHCKALYLLGVCYFNGEGVTQDTIKSIELIKTASEAGHHEAQISYNLLLDHKNECEYYCPDFKN